MKLWKIEQSVNDDYDTYSDAVVAASCAEEAQCIHPSGSPYNNEWWAKPRFCEDWASRTDQVKVTLIDEAVEGTEKGVICASFHAG
jgi:hypothetical protein